MLPGIRTAFVYISMSMGRAILISVFVLCTACAQIPAAPTQTPAVYTDRDAENIAALARMEAHLQMSLQLWEAGKYELAAAHAGHPVYDQYDYVENPLKAKQAEAPLRSALDAYAALAGKAGDAARVKAAHQKAIAAIHTAEQVLAGSWLADPIFQAEVVRELLEGVSDFYHDVVVKHDTEQLLMYQDASAFLTLSKELYNPLKTAAQAKNPQEAQQIDQQFAVLDTYFPTALTLPDHLVDVEQVDDATDKIVTTLQITFGRPPGAPGS